MYLDRLQLLLRLGMTLVDDIVLYLRLTSLRGYPVFLVRPEIGNPILYDLQIRIMIPGYVLVRCHFAIFGFGLVKNPTEIL